MKKQLTPAGGYVRMSTDQQKDSPERQRAEVTKLAERDGYRFVEWYEDHGMTGTESKRRLSFQRLLRDAKAGKFKVVLLSEQSRASREEVLFVIANQWLPLRDAGVSIATCQRGLLDFNNMSSLLTAIIDQYGAHDESKKIAERTASGKRLCIAKGLRIGGKPFGFDRQFIDETGKVARVVSFRDKAQKPKDWTVRLVPSAEREAVEAVRFMFERVAAGWTVNKIRQALHVKGIRNVAKYWSTATVTDLLQNPVYCGDTAFGRFVSGKFSRMTDDGKLVIHRNTHKGIVSRELYDRVQSIIACRPKNHAKRKPGRYLLTGLIRCGCCGGPVSGKTADHAVCYRCEANGRNAAKCCESPLYIEAKVLECRVVEELKKVLRDERDRLEQAIKGMSSRKTSEPAAEADAARRTLDARIERLMENLAEAEPENRPGLNKILVRLQRERAALLEQAVAAIHAGRLAPGASNTIEELDGLIDNLELSSREELAQAIAATVSEIRVIRSGRDATGRKGARVTMAFRSGAKPVSFEMTGVGIPCRWHLLRDYVLAEYPRAVQKPELVQFLSMSHNNKASFWLLAKKACREGLIRKVDGFNGGWVAAKAVAKVKAG